MPVLFTPHRGRGIPVYVTTTTTEKLGSETIVKCRILEDKYNYQVIRGVCKRWTLTQLKGPNDHREYVAFIIDRQTHGRLQEVSISLREKPIDIINRHVVHNKISGPYQAQDFLDVIFKGTGLSYEVPSDLYFADVKDCGEGETVKDLVKKAMDIWDLEFEIKFSSKTKKYTFVFTSYLEKRADYHIDDEINANNMKYEEDSGELYTYAVGYGDYTDDEGLEGAGLIEYFEHPEMKDIGKYEAPPIKDGTIKDPDIMKAKLQTLIYESIKISLTLDFITLRKYYPNAIPKIGDVVKVKHSILGINQFMRIVEVTTVRDADNKIVKQDVTLGDFNRHARYLKRLSEAAQVIGGLGGGSFASNYRKTESKANSAATRGGKGSKPVEIKGEDGKTYDLSEITVDKDGNLKVKEVN